MHFLCLVKLEEKSAFYSDLDYVLLDLTGKILLTSLIVCIDFLELSCFHIMAVV